MKKSLVALAVLAASGAAMAQSSVTMYGAADIWFGSVKVDDKILANANTTTTVLNTSGAATSRWGMKGTEDLGGGLKANFDLQQGFALDSGAANGASSSRVFDRQAWVGFSGGFGEVRLGRTTTPFDNLSGASNGMFDSDLAPANGADGYGMATNVFVSAGYSSRQDNMLYYKSPTFGGLTGDLSYSLREGAVGGTTVTSLGLVYAGGPLAVQFAYQLQDVDGKNDDATFTRLGASYNFGMATAKVSFGNAKNTAIDYLLYTTGGYSKIANTGNVKDASTTEWQLGVDVPVGANIILTGSYAKSDSNLEAGDVDRSGFGLGAAYILSKRTLVYGGVKSMKIDTTGPDADVTIFGLGVKHMF